MMFNGMFCAAMDTGAAAGIVKSNVCPDFILKEFSAIGFDADATCPVPIKSWILARDKSGAQCAKNLSSRQPATESSAVKESFF